MKKLAIAAGTLILSSMLIACGGGGEGQKKDTKLIGMKDVKLTSNLMQPETLWMFGRLGDVAVSPDGKQVAYTVTWYDIEENAGNSEIYIMNTDGSDKKQLTKTPERENSLTWRPDGKVLNYMSGGQLWEMNPDGTGAKQLTSIEGGISGYLFSPTLTHVLFAKETKIEKMRGTDIYPDLPKSDVYVYDDLMYRHWDSWADGNYSHLYIAEYTGSTVGTPVDIMPNEPFDSPMKPFGGMEEVAWSPDGKQLAYTCKKLKGKEYAFSTDSNIYLYDLNSKQTTLLTPNMPGYDKQPVYSPDGKQLAWLSMERAGYEADKERLFIYDFGTKTMKESMPNFDTSPSSMQWSSDSKNIYFTACIMSTYRIFKLNVESGNIEQLSKDGMFDYQNIRLIDESMVLVNRTDFMNPAEIYRVDIANQDAEPKNLSEINKPILDQLNLPTFELRTFKNTVDGSDVLTWVFYPPNFDKSKKYPAILFCTGGPQGTSSPSYSYRWSFALMASQDYIVAYPCRRGVSGISQKWTDAISRHHGELDEIDHLSAIDALAKEPYVDENHLGATGASYGGFSIYHLMGTHNKRFKAMIAHCGIFNFSSMYTTTEEMFFEEWEKGGPIWETPGNKELSRIYAQSPINFVKNWDTPLMVIHGGRDYRVPYAQGMAAFNAAQMMGVPSKFVYFPEENHWVLKPQNAIAWQREFFGWFDEYLKK